MPAAVAIAFKISDTFAALPEANPIVVLPLAVVTVVTLGSKVMVWAPLAPVMVRVVPVGALASALRMVPLRWGVAEESSDVVVDAIANALSCNATEPVRVVEVGEGRLRGAGTCGVADPAVLKKLSPAVTAEAATSEVPASFLIAVFSAVLRFVAVLFGLTGTLASIAKLPTGVGVALDAVRSICSVEPSGSVNCTLSLSPFFGLTPLD